MNQRDRMETLRTHVKFNDGLCLRRPQDNMHAGEWFPGEVWDQGVHWGSDQQNQVVLDSDF